MRRNLAQPKLPDLPLRTVKEMGLKELERIRLILRGGSVIEWRRMHFQSREEVDRFLRLCQIDPSKPEDEAWVRRVLAEAVEYLRNTFNYRVAEAVANPGEIHDVFLFASGLIEPQKYRKIACIVLKVMHVIQHMEGRDLLFRLAVSEVDLAKLVSERVMRVAEEGRAKGLSIVEFADSIKARDSLITKLLAKKETLAAQIYDRTRFRIVTRTRDDILPVLYFLTQRLFPFNFVVPNQSENSLLSFKALLKQHPHLAKHADNLHLDLDYEERHTARRSKNKFSGSGYRVLNFVVDLPLRLDAYLPPEGKAKNSGWGRIGFALVELQIVDEETARKNEVGDNAHERYKERQLNRVLRRLSRGLVVPKKSKQGKAPKAIKQRRKKGN